LTAASSAGVDVAFEIILRDLERAEQILVGAGSRRVALVVRPVLSGPAIIAYPWPARVAGMDGAARGPRA
jgi:hypothetical protein